MTSYTRPRFSLRTLLVVVTLVSIWLGWNWRTMKSRQQILESIQMAGGFTFNVLGTAKISVIRNLLGDRPHEQIILPEDRFSTADVRHIESLFPEAGVFRASQRVVQDMKMESQVRFPPSP